MKKRLLASLLSATILLSMTPMAFADEEPVGEDITEPAQVETVDETVPQAEPQEEDNAPVVQEDPQAEETPADIVIDSDTTWSEARTLTGDLTVNSGATLTIGAQVTVSGDVTISGGGTIQRAKSYTGDVANYQENATDKEGNVLDTAPATAHLFYVTEDSSLTVQDICMDGNAGWTLSNAAPVIDNKTELTDYQAQGLTPVIGALICNMGQLTVGDGAVLQNNFNFYQTDLSGTGLGGAVYNAGDMTVTGSAVIQYNSSRYGGGIRNEDGSALLIQGGSIQYNNGSAGAAGIMANAEMDFKMTGGEINGNASPATAGWPVGTGIFFGYGVKATLTGGSITNNVGYHTGAGIYIRFDSDQVDIGKVLISGNQALNDRDNGKYNGKGGGIYAEGGDVTISGATITNNTAEQNGAGVMVGHNDKADHCTVNITGDTEIKNNHGGIGGGVYVANDAECSISGNTKIENNTTGTTVWSTAPSGGGIAVIAKGVLNISENVSIQNNQAVKYGGGIYSNGTVEINGTNVMISGNKAERGGGIDHREKTVSVLGSVVISGNTVNGKANNFYPEYRTPPKDNPATPAEFNSNSLVIVTGQLTPGASIGVTLPDQLTQLTTTVAKGTDTYNVTSSDAAYFTYDGGNKLVQKATDSNTLVLADAAAIRAVTFNLPEQVKVSCANPVEVADGADLTVTFDVAYGYKLKYAYAGETQKLDITNNAITLSNVTADTTVTVSVDPKAVNVSTNEINGVYGQKLEKQVIETAYYDDEESDLSIIKSCEVNADEDQLPEGLELRNDGMLIGTPKEVGTFNLYVDFTADNGQSNGQTVIVEIGKADYDMSGVSFEDATYPYDGKEKTLEITGQLPEGVTVSYENNTLTNAGSVRAKAEFTVADTEHYNEIDEVLYADLTITKATPTITIKPDQATLTGSGTVTLTVEKPEDGKVTVTCDKEGVTVTENEDGTFTATLPNADETYTFTATVKYDETANYVNVDPVTCTVTVTYQSTSHGGGGSSRNNSYAVSTPKADNGSVTINNGSTAKKGDTVTITVKPDAGYEIDKVTVTDSKGNTITVTDKGDGKFSFTMPDGKVDVKVTFVKSEVKPDQSSKSGFVDVPENSWYADAADFVAQRGLMSGVGENFFGGSQNTTRAMLMTILACMDGQDVTGGATWYEKAMNWAKQTGVSDGTMPEVNITREQLATMLYSYAKLKGMDPIPNGMALSKFSDADSISTWASEAVSWAAYSGIISGRSNGTVDPQAGATRAEMAVMLQQFVKLMEK